MTVLDDLEKYNTRDCARYLAEAQLFASNPRRARFADVIVAVQDVSRQAALLS